MKTKLLYVCTLLLTMLLSFGFGIHTHAANFPEPEAPGINVSTTANSEIDYSNIRYGYVKVRYNGTANVRVVLTAPNGTQYQYRINNNNNWEVIPLSEGNGRYQIGLFEQVSGNRFAVVDRIDVTVTLENEFAPFLRPNQFVNFNRNSRVVTLADEVTRGSTSVVDSVGRIFQYVVDNIEYDFELARTVQSGYVPNLDQVLQRRRGICFDYAALMTAMTRSQGIPTKLVIGYVGDVFHAWISVYSEDTGWIEDIIFFDGNEWRIMDPTFAATANQSAEVMRFIGDGQNHNPTHFH